MGFDFGGFADTALGIVTGKNKDNTPSFGSTGRTSLSSYLDLSSFRNLKKQMKGFTLKRVLNGTAIRHVYNSGARIKGYLIDAVTGDTRKFQYNPQSMEYSRGANYGEIKSPGMQYPIIYFVNGDSENFDLELFIVDRPSTGKINKDIAWCKSFLPRYRNDMYFSRPHPIIYAYGNYICKCVVTNVRTRIDEYDEEGEPWLAHITLSLKVVDIPATQTTTSTNIGVYH